MKSKYYIHFLLLCSMSLLTAGSVSAMQLDKGENTSEFSTSDHYNLNIDSIKLDFKCSDPYFGSNGGNYMEKSGFYFESSILVPRIIKTTKGESPVIIFQAGNDMIYYHNFFKIVLKN